MYCCVVSTGSIPASVGAPCRHANAWKSSKVQRVWWPMPSLDWHSRVTARRTFAPSKPVRSCGRLGVGVGVGDEVSDWGGRIWVVGFFWEGSKDAWGLTQLTSLFSSSPFLSSPYLILRAPAATTSHTDSRTLSRWYRALGPGIGLASPGPIFVFVLSLSSLG